MKRITGTGFGRRTIIHLYIFMALFSVSESLRNINCFDENTLMSSLSDLLRQYNFVRNIYLLLNDGNQCDPDFETVFGEQGISFEVYGLSSFNEKDFYGTQYLSEKLLIMYSSFQKRQNNEGSLNETLLHSFPTILYVSSTKQVSNIFHKEVDYEMQLLHPAEVNKTILWQNKDGRWTIGGTWSASTGWSFPSKPSIPSVTMNGRQLTVATLPGYQFSVRHVINGTVVYSGLYIT